MNGAFCVCFSFIIFSVFLLTAKSQRSLFLLMAFLAIFRFIYVVGFFVYRAQISDRKGCSKRGTSSAYIHSVNCIHTNMVNKINHYRRQRICLYFTRATVEQQS